MTAEEGVPLITSTASPEEWAWNVLDASRPRRATEHIAHSEVAPVTIDRLRARDSPLGSNWTLLRGIPIIVIDTLDAYWAFETVLNKLHGTGRTQEEAKGDLVSRLGGHLHLLGSLESPVMARLLRLELEFLRAVLRPVESSGS